MIFRASKLELAWPSATLMVTKEMLKFGYQFGQGLGAVGHGKASLIEIPNNKGGFGLSYDPSNKELFQASRGNKRKCIGQGLLFVYSPHHGYFFGSSRGHQIRSSTGIMQGVIRFGLSHSSLFRRILNECHHIPRG